MNARPENKIETHFEEPGSLPRPRIVGRLVRLLLGLWLLWALYTVLAVGWEVLVDTTPPSRPDWWLFIAIAFWITPAIVNIGFAKNWKRRPQWVILLLVGLAIAVDLAVYSSWWAPPLGAFVWLWLIYFSAHLGFSFVLSAIISTPGCEMRSIPHLWTLITGRPTREHYCPSFIDRVDRWEVKRAR